MTEDKYNDEELLDSYSNNNDKPEEEAKTTLEEDDANQAYEYDEIMKDEYAKEEENVLYDQFDNGDATNIAQEETQEDQVVNDEEDVSKLPEIKPAENLSESTAAVIDDRNEENDNYTNGEALVDDHAIETTDTAPEQQDENDLATEPTSTVQDELINEEMKSTALPQESDLDQQLQQIEEQYLNAEGTETAAVTSNTTLADGIDGQGEESQLVEEDNAMEQQVEVDQHPDLTEEANDIDQGTGEEYNPSSIQDGDIHNDSDTQENSQLIEQETINKIEEELADLLQHAEEQELQDGKVHDEPDTQENSQMMQQTDSNKIEEELADILQHTEEQELQDGNVHDESDTQENSQMMQQTDINKIEEEKANEVQLSEEGELQSLQVEAEAIIVKNPQESSLPAIETTAATNEAEIENQNDMPSDDEQVEDSNTLNDNTSLHSEKSEHDQDTSGVYDNDEEVNPVKDSESITNDKPMTSQNQAEHVDEEVTSSNQLNDDDNVEDDMHASSHQQLSQNDEGADEDHLNQQDSENLASNIKETTEFEVHEERKSYHSDDEMIQDVNTTYPEDENINESKKEEEAADSAEVPANADQLISDQALETPATNTDDHLSDDQVKDEEASHPSTDDVVNTKTNNHDRMNPPPEIHIDNYDNSNSNESSTNSQSHDDFDGDQVQQNADDYNNNEPTDSTHQIDSSDQVDGGDAQPNQDSSKENEVIAESNSSSDIRQEDEEANGDMDAIENNKALLTDSSNTPALSRTNTDEDRQEMELVSASLTQDQVRPIKYV